MSAPRVRLPRFFCPSPLRPESLCDLPPETAHHAANVLRLAADAEIVLFDGCGGEYPARITAISRAKDKDRNRVTVKLGEYRAIERESPLGICLAQTLQAGDKMDYTLQKAVELGVSVFLPLQGRRSVLRLSGERSGKRVARWREIIIAACEQCGRNRIPEIAPIALLEEWLWQEGKALRGLKLILSVDASQPLSTLELPSPQTPITLLVGAEGGFDPAELKAAWKAGFHPTRLGSRVLRTETAGLAALAILQSRWGDL